MNLQTFEQQFEACLRERIEVYPNASRYLRHSLLDSVDTYLDTVLEHLTTQTNRTESYWRHHEQVMSEILQVTQMTPEELSDLKIPELSPDTRDFKTIQEKLYETPYYPVSEHLYYIDFEPALERIRFISTQLRKLSHDRVDFCDLGFGPGVLMRFMLSQRPKWRGYGVDVSSHCNRYAKRLLEINGLTDRAELQSADVRSLPYADGSFDLVVAMEVFEHIPNPIEGLREAVRVLKPGGHALTSIPVRLPIAMHLFVPQEPQEVLELYERASLKVLEFQIREFTSGSGSFIDTYAFSVKA